MEHLRSGPVIAVDLNHGHLAVCVLDPSGNPIGAPVSVPLELTGLKASTRDGRIRQAISCVLALARTHGAGAVVIEDLDFVAWREEGRERSGRRPSRGKRAKGFRRLVAGLPTGKFRDRLVQMAANNGVAVIASIPPTPRAGAPSTGSSTSGRSRPRRAATTRRPSSSDDADSDIGHDDGKGVTRHEQCIVTRELPTPSCQVTAARTPNRRTGRQVGSRDRGRGPFLANGTLRRRGD